MAQLTKPSGSLYALIIGISLMTLSSAQADTLIYKWIDKNGVVSFSQEPPKESGAHDVTQMTVKELPVAQQRAANRLLLNLDKEENDDFSAYQKNMKQADQNVNSALQNLKNAERNLTEGSIPTGYDRVGNFGGHARLRESYFNRVSELQQDVDQARQELNDAYTSRDQLFPAQ